MASITTLNGGDLISGSRTDINTNFSNLNTDKIETSTLDTDTTLAANSDSKIATQKAVKTYVDATASPVGKSWNEYAAANSGTDSYTITVAGVTAYVTGQTFKFKADVANTGACSVNVNGLGAKTIKKDVSTDLLTGDIIANQLIIVTYDGTNMQIQSTSGGSIPTVQTFVVSTTTFGNNTTQFDITNPIGTTFRYTWDTTGTDPVINAATVPVGTIMAVMIINCTNANNGVFTVTGSGTNYFEVTNASGVVESDMSIGSGGAIKKANPQTWTKPTGLKYAIIEGVGAGGAGGYSTSDGLSGGGGGAGGYFKKTIATTSLSSTETIYIGIGGLGLTIQNDRIPLDGSATLFGSILTANPGLKGESNDSSALGGLGGTSTGGDINVIGGDGGTSMSTATSISIGGIGGGSFFGSGGYNGSNDMNGTSGRAYGSGGGGSANQSTTEYRGGDGAGGIVIVTEYY